MVNIVQEIKRKSHLWDFAKQNLGYTVISIIYL